MHKEDLIKVKQYISDLEGHKEAAVIGLEELNRLEAMIEVFLQQRPGSTAMARHFKVS